MDALLQTLGVQTFNYAVRSGIALTSKYAVQQCTRLLKSVNDKAVRTELKALQNLLDSRIKIISPALDLIEFKSGRGNIFLESAVPLAKSLHREIVRLGKRLESAATAEEDARLQGLSDRVSDDHHVELLLIINDIKSLLGRIDRDIPLLQLAITASGEKMSSTMTPGISPSRMMQASALLSFADANFVMDPGRPLQVGPSFTLSLYMLFLGHSRIGSGSNPGSGPPLTPPGSVDDSGHGEVPYGVGEDERKPIWQEVMHKARVRLCRTPPGSTFHPLQGYCPTGLPGSKHPSRKTSTAPPGHPDGYSYHLEIIEDLNDGRLHDGDGPAPRPYDDIPMAGIRESIPIHQVSKIFYADTGRILNIGINDERDNNPVLLVKRDLSAKSPSKMREEWFNEPETGLADDSHSDSSDNSFGSHDQEDIDRQLWEETGQAADSPRHEKGLRTTHLPAHLDPEWLALEVFAEGDDEGDEEEEEDEGVGDGSDYPNPQTALTIRPQSPRDRLSVNSKLVAQMRRISLRGESPPKDLTNQPPTNLSRTQQQTAEPYVARSPFGAIATSLSLLEMLVRLTSLQEFQQTSHLAIPDHILTFFLEETSTTGLHGEAHWRMRTEAKRRMGFDPYSDAVPRGRGPE